MTAGRTTTSFSTASFVSTVPTPRAKREATTEPSAVHGLTEQPAVLVSRHKAA